MGQDLSGLYSSVWSAPNHRERSPRPPLLYPLSFILPILHPYFSSLIYLHAPSHGTLHRQHALYTSLIIQVLTSSLSFSPIRHSWLFVVVRIQQLFRESILKISAPRKKGGKFTFYNGKAIANSNIIETRQELAQNKSHHHTIYTMKFLDIQAVIGTAILLLSLPCDAKHSHRLQHLEVMGKRHDHNKIHASPRAAGFEEKLEKRGSCEFPSDAGLVAVTPGSSNAGWAMSPDQPCSPGGYCPFACPPGQVMAQWNPAATAYVYPQSMVCSNVVDPGNLLT